ncbi:MAG: hypothetical protein K8I02_02095, partial [Candidatus Methylomirabilis sp.]|nr:hypothetical protein [Deltaproteobacteria bacterium]
MSFPRAKRFSALETVGIAALAVWGVQLSAWAVTVPNAFSPGEVASSSEVNANFQALADAVTALEDKTRFLVVEEDALNGMNGPHLIVRGANLHVQSGSGCSSDGDPGAACAPTGVYSGLGNLIVGYAENYSDFARDGSHNLVVGVDNGFAAYGGLVAGATNIVSAPAASAVGGIGGVASGFA